MRDPEPTNEAVGATNEVVAENDDETDAINIISGDGFHGFRDDDIDLQDFEPEMAPDMPLIFFY